MAICAGDYRSVGPYRQTMFMGCSIIRFNMNIGWGQDSSECTVELIQDSSQDTTSARYAQLLTRATSDDNSPNTTPANIFAGGDRTLFRSMAKNILDPDNPAPSAAESKQTWDGPTGVSISYAAADPGFVGIDYDVIGTPVRFKFDAGLEFCGMVTNWKAKGSRGGYPLYDVTIRSYNKLLSNCYMIIDGYTGSISSQIPNDDNVAPMLMTEDDATYTFDRTIADGNIPNIFNIYGYLGFGNTGKSSIGVSARQIYYALQDLAGGVKNAYSPYGHIVGKHLSAIITTAGGSDVNTNGTVYGSTSLCGHGLLKTVTGIDGIFRSLFKLDISEVPVPPADMYINSGATISIMEFIDTICEGAGYDYYVTTIPSYGGNETGYIKIKTVSRRIQPPKDVLKNVVNQLLGANAKVTSYSYGQEYTDAISRSIKFGGYQQRLLQIQSDHLSSKQSCLVYDPFLNFGAGGFVSYNTSVNYIREPNLGSTRRNAIFTEGTSIVGQYYGTTNFNTMDTFGASSVRRGNYRRASLINVGPAITSSSYPLYNELICPYFGEHGTTEDTTSTDTSISYANPRKVYFDRNMGQLQIVFNSRDITQHLSRPFSALGQIVVLENELRAAGAGFESWVMYCFGSRFYTDIEGLMYRALRSSYPDLTRKGEFISAIQSINWETAAASLNLGKKSSINTQIGTDSTNTFKKIVYEELNKVWKFFSKIAQDYYAQKYLVRVPNVAWYSEGTNLANLGSSYAIPGTGKIFTAWEVAKDGAWEEPGNIIDDTMYIGSTAADFFTEEDGKIKAIAGFNACADWSSKDEFTNVWYNSVYDNDPMTATSINIIKSRYGGNNYWFFPLEHTIPASDHLYLQWNGRGSTTAFGRSIPANQTYKMYSTITVNPGFVVANNRNHLMIDLPAPVYVGGGKYANENSVTLTQYHDTIVAHRRGSTTPAGVSSSAGYMKPSLLISITAPDDVNSLNQWLNGEGAAMIALALSANGSSNNTSNNLPLLKKAACPGFMAIPIKSNLNTYGPWVNHPGLEFDRNYVNNMAGGIKADFNADYVPWNYGGISALDGAVMSTIKDEVNYTQVMEQGNITLAGFALFNADSTMYGIGDILVNSANETNGPLLNSVSTDISEQGITTSYTFRTYTRKIGFFNKDNADRIRRIGQEFMKRSRDANIQTNQLLNRLKDDFQNNTNTQDYYPGQIPKQLQTSPLEILCGQAQPQVNHNSSAANLFDSVGLKPDWHINPTTTNTPKNPRDYPRSIASVGLSHVAEIPREFQEGYAYKSMMSLDGILSPISYYPTPYGSTYHITKYPKENCPFCKGTGKYKWNRPNNLSSVRTAAAFRSAFTETEDDCHFCEAIVEKNKRRLVTAAPNETTPPYVIASGDDLTIVSRNSSGLPAGISGNPIINYSTYNPVILSNGEFSCDQNKQNNDTTAHSIDLVAFGNDAPSTRYHSLKYAYSNNNPSECVGALDSVYATNSAARGGSPQSPLPANNIRYFGLRGPLMVHAWGYDTEGFPVPNASGEPKLDSNGNIQKDNNGNIVYKNQQQLADGSWTKPYKEHKFFNGWGQLPSTWPVGPVDLRWDDRAGLWTVGANYKPVWILLETDLIDGQPSRGEIISDVAYDNNPLPSGLRKLVYVRDNMKINPAPRGAPVYCKYNSAGGFYEPIYNKPLITSGIIQGATTVDIYNLYKNRDQTYSTQYTNPLNFSVSYGDIGLFIYIASGWVLQSSNC